MAVNVVACMELLNKWTREARAAGRPVIVKRDGSHLDDCRCKECKERMTVSY